LEAYRTTDVNTPRVGLISRTGYTPLNPNGLRDATWTDVCFRAADVTGVYRRTLNFRGVFDEYVEWDGQQWTVNPALINLINAWKAAGVFPGAPSLFGWRALTRLGPNAPKVVNNVVPQMIGQLLLYNCPAHGFSIGDFVTIKGLAGANIRLLPPSKASLNGIRRITSVPNVDQFTAGVRDTDLPGTPIITRAGQAAARNFAYPQISTIQFLKVTRRATGAPFFRQVGHRRAIRRT
jgi:hypothetical protein